MAVWFYMPSTSRLDVAFCDEHVSRGCSCNIDPNTGIEDTDEQGRLFPCCEYLFDNRGWDEEQNDEDKETTD
jgi:hypothetical protein